MSSTNHTTNYNLPQFLGSDKPAWLGDINPAMSAIDTAMHANATTAAQGVSDAATAKDRADAAYTKAGDAETAAGTAQTTANQAVATGNTNAGRITALENKFILSEITTVTNMQTGAFGNNYYYSLAQNTDGSIFKFYGIWYIDNNTGSSISTQKTAVSGLTGIYGFATGVYLNTAPDEAYRIAPTGIFFASGNPTAKNAYESSIAVGTDGQIYVLANGIQTETLGANSSYRDIEVPCIYFNTNFGDEPINNN